MELHLNPNRRHDFVLFFDVTNGNPNGDPDAGNLPRFDPETNHGFVTDVALKRKIRDYVSLIEEKPIHIQSRTALNTLYFQTMKEEGFDFPEAEVNDEEFFEWLKDEASEVFEVVEENIVKYTHEFTKAKDIEDKIKEAGLDIPKEFEENLKKLKKDLDNARKNLKKLSPKDREKIKEKMVQKYFDIRMFGAVLTAGTNAGQVRGPVQLTFAKSVSPIFPMDLTITRIAITKESDKRRKDTEMGRKPIIPYGLYRAHGFYNPKLAERLVTEGDKHINPVSEDDLRILWDAIQNMFDFDRSAARGEMAFRALYIFSHTDEKGRGNAHAHELFELVGTELKDKSNPPRSYKDYYPLIKSKEFKELKEFPKGVEVKTFGIQEE